MDIAQRYIWRREKISIVFIKFFQRKARLFHNEIFKWIWKGNILSNLHDNQRVQRKKFVQKVLS